MKGRIEKINDPGKSDLLDQSAFKPLDASEREAITEARSASRNNAPNETSASDLAVAIGAGNSSENQPVATPTLHSGVLNQTIVPSEIGPAGTGDDSDISGILANS